jgi:hypothetical protein
MSNLLPPAVRARLWPDARGRLITSVAGVLIGGAFVTAAALAPSLLVLVMTQISSDKQKSALGGDQTKVVNDAQALVSQLGAIIATSSPARTIAWSFATV